MQHSLKVMFMALVIPCYSSLAQDKPAKKETHKIKLQITEEVNGKSIHIDTTYTSDQQPAITAYLKSLGIEFENPPKPPAPPVPPGAPAPPEPPSPPPAPPAFDGDFSFHFDKNIMSEKEQEELAKAMQKINEELKDFKMPELPDLDEHDIHIYRKNMDNMKEEMEELKEEMEKLQEKIKDIKIEIKEEDKDEKSGKDHSLNNSGPNEKSFHFSFSDSPGPESKKCKQLIYAYADDQAAGPEKKCIQYHIIKSSGGEIDVKESMPEENSADNKQQTRDKPATELSESPSGLKTSNSYQLNPSDINIFPNPGDGNFNLNFRLDSKSPVKIKIMDTGGKIVYDETLENFNGVYNNQINISAKGRGVYLLSITQENQWFHKKIMVK